MFEVYPEPTDEQVLKSLREVLASFHKQMSTIAGNRERVLGEILLLRRQMHAMDCLVAAGLGSLREAPNGNPILSPVHMNVHGHHFAERERRLARLRSELNEIHKGERYARWRRKCLLAGIFAIHRNEHMKHAQVQIS